MCSPTHATDKQAIGENREEPTPKPVTTTEDVGAFVSTHMRELFNKAGLKTVDGDGAVTIKGEVTQFFVRETSVYRSEVDSPPDRDGPEWKSALERHCFRRRNAIRTLL